MHHSIVYFSVSVARQLHEDNILDEHLKLRKKSSLIEEFDKEETDPRKPKAGTRRSRSYYPVELPDEFKSVKIDKQVCFVYRWILSRTKNIICAELFFIFVPPLIFFSNTFSLNYKINLLFVFTIYLSKSVAGSTSVWRKSQSSRAARNGTSFTIPSESIANWPSSLDKNCRTRPLSPFTSSPFPDESTLDSSWSESWKNWLAKTWNSFSTSRRRRFRRFCRAKSRGRGWTETRKIFWSFRSTRPEILTWTASRPCCNLRKSRLKTFVSRFDFSAKLLN